MNEPNCKSVRSGAPEFSKDKGESSLGLPPMGVDQNARIPLRLYVAVTISLLTLPLPLALSKGNFFHHITIYDHHWFLFVLAYIGGTAGAVLLTGSAHLKINAQEAMRAKRLVWFAYSVAGFCFISMHILRIYFRGAFDYLESLI